MSALLKAALGAPRCRCGHLIESHMGDCLMPKCPCKNPTQRDDAPTE